jgi:prepilin-type processing-associated H-X9-DG protein
MEPERHIEKLLRTYAERRRSETGAGPELHPATRRLLQGEVARLRAGRGEESWLTGFLLLLRRRLVMAACVVTIALVGATLMLPALSTAKSKSKTVSAMNNLKQIGLAVLTFADDNRRLPGALSEVKSMLPDQVLIDPASGQPFIYVGGDKTFSNLEPASVLAYSPADKKGRTVLFADGHVVKVSREQFEELATREVALISSAANRVRREPTDAVSERRLSRSSPTFSAQSPATTADSAPARADAEVTRMKLADATTYTTKDRGATTQPADMAGKERSPPPPQSAPAPSPAAAAVAETEVTQPAAAATRSANGLAVSSGQVQNEDVTVTSRSLGVVKSEGALASDEGLNRPVGGTKNLEEQKAATPPPGRDREVAAAAHKASVAPERSFDDSLPKTKSFLLEKGGLETPTAPESVLNSQRFVQIRPASPPLAPDRSKAASLAQATPVLTAFRMEQSGNGLRVVDQDGSVYQGYVELTNAVAGLQQAAGSNQLVVPPAELPPASQPAWQNFYFRVSGWNRSVQQNVMFSGNLAAGGESATTLNWASNTAPGLVGRYQAVPVNQVQLPLNNSRITGTAVLGNRQELQIIAVPTAP